MKKLFKTTLASALLMVSAFASAVTVKDAKVNLPLIKPQAVLWHWNILLWML